MRVLVSVFVSVSVLVFVSVLGSRVGGNRVAAGVFASPLPARRSPRTSHEHGHEHEHGHGHEHARPASKGAA